jgi:Recombinase
MGGIAQWYSDNLSQETKKGRGERHKQGLYNGLLPFGTAAGAGRLPGADRRPFCVLHWVERAGRRVVDGGRQTCNFEGLRLAMRLGAEGATDGAVAQALNAAGYRTTGNRGANQFHKDTVAEMLTNRFYWGELPVFAEVKENGATRKAQVDWAPAKHDALPGFDEPLWERIQATRAGNRTRNSKTRSRARTYALTGLLTCHACGGPVGIMAASTGEPRLSCRRRARHKTDCPNRLTYQDVYEQQIGAYLAAFQIPDDYQERLLAAARAISPDRERHDTERRDAETRLERIKKLYEWGDKPEAEYLAERAVLQQKVRALRPAGTDTENLEALAAVLRDLRTAWAVSNQEERNHLARAVFEDVRVLDDRVVGLKPRPAFAPFFVLNDEAMQAEATGMRCA